MLSFTIKYRVIRFFADVIELILIFRDDLQICFLVYPLSVVNSSTRVTKFNSYILILNNFNLDRCDVKNTRGLLLGPENTSNDEDYQIVPLYVTTWIKGPRGFLSLNPEIWEGTHLE